MAAERSSSFGGGNVASSGGVYGVRTDESERGWPSCSGTVYWIWKLPNN